MGQAFADAGINTSLGSCGFGPMLLDFLGTHDHWVSLDSQLDDPASSNVDRCKDLRVFRFSLPGKVITRERSIVEVMILISMTKYSDIDGLESSPMARNHDMP